MDGAKARMGIATAATVATVLLCASVASGQTCIDDVTGRNNNCTANDVSLTVLNAVSVADGCTSAVDTAQLFFQTRLEPGSPDRYDIGIFIALDGGDAFTGTCFQGALTPIAIPPANDPVSGSGPYADIENPAGGPFTDVCGDIIGGQVTFYNLPSAVTVNCTDTDADGFLDVGTCVSWDNQDRINCPTLDDAVPGTPAKCNCERSPVALAGVPLGVPNLGITKSCIGDVVRPGNFVRCTVTYTNTGGGPADLVAWVDDYPETVGTVENIVMPAGDTVSDDGAQLTWTPGGAPETVNNIAAGATASITYDFRVNNDPALDGTMFCNTATLTQVGIAQSLSATDCTNIATTAASIGGVWIERHDGETFAVFDAVDEAGTVGYRLERRVGARWVQVGPGMVPALVEAPQGGYYRIPDATIGRREEAEYRILELERTGRVRTYGPFDAQLADATPGPSDRFGRNARRLRTHTAAHAAERLPSKMQHDGAVEVSVSRDGLVAIEAADLAVAWGRSVQQVARDVRNGKLTVRQRGKEVAWSALDDGRRLVFWGRAPDVETTTENVYRVDRERGVRMTVASIDGASPVQGSRVARQTVAREVDAFPLITAPLAPEDDFWFWGFVPAVAGAGFDLPIVVDEPIDQGNDAGLRLRLYGFQDDAIHHLEAFFGGASVGELRWEGGGFRTFDLPLDAAQLQAGAGLRLEPVLDQGAQFFNVMVDGYELTYDRRLRAHDDQLTLSDVPAGDLTIDGLTTGQILAFEISDPRRPVRLEGVVTTPENGGWSASFAAEAGASYALVGIDAAETVEPRAVQGQALLEGANAADYLIVTHPSLRADVEAIAEYRRGQGHAVLVTTLEEIVGAVNHGIREPLAIRELLRYARDHWARAPSHLLLAANGTFDWRDLMGAGDNLVPTVLQRTRFGLFAADGRFGDLDEDGVPDIAVGRLPFLDPTEVASYLTRVTAAENAHLGAPGPGNVLVLADDDDDMLTFRSDADGLAARVDGQLVERVYLDQTHSLQAARDAVVAAVDEGLGLWAYVGHGNLLQLADERLVGAPEVQRLANDGALPVVAAFTCNVGRFEIPGFPPMVRNLVLADSGGAAAVWAPSGQLQHHQSQSLARAFFDARYRQGVRVLGDAILSAQRELARSSDAVDTLLAYNLIGEPVLVLP